MEGLLGPPPVPKNVRYGDLLPFDRNKKMRLVTEIARPDEIGNDSPAGMSGQDQHAPSRVPETRMSSQRQPRTQRTRSAPGQAILSGDETQMEEDWTNAGAEVSTLVPIACCCRSHAGCVPLSCPSP